jgi:hypothetical protein
LFYNLLCLNIAVSRFQNPVGLKTASAKNISFTKPHLLPSGAPVAGARRDSGIITLSDFTPGSEGERLPNLSHRTEGS